VTSHGAGLAVPNWPNSFDYNMFLFPVSQWVGGIFYEHTHRLVASSVGLLTTVLALWLYGKKSRGLLRWTGVGLLVAGLAVLAWSPARRGDGAVAVATGAVAVLSSFVWPSGEPAPRWLRRLGLLAFALVVMQGVLGGLRVVLLKDEIGVFHAALAQLFFVLVCAMGLFTSRWWQESRAGERGAESDRTAGVRWWCIGGTVLIFAQLVLGATMRHQHAGLAIPDFPLAYGRVWPATDRDSVAAYNSRRIEVTAANPITAGQIHLQMAHRILALGIAVVVAGCAYSMRRRMGSKHALARLGLVWVIMILSQILLGAATIWSDKAADVATAHVTLGALTLALGAMLSMVSSRDLLSHKFAARTIVPVDIPVLTRLVASGGPTTTSMKGSF
jgi:cytochrome c oxidase assembly protein subunit 15